MHGHGTSAGAVSALGPAQWLVLLVVAGAVLAYLAGVSRLRGVAWPLSRLLAWIGGWTCVGAALVGPLAERAHHDFTAHMAGHIALGMLAPLMLVFAAPVTLLLRVLPTARARPVARALASRPAAVVTHPLTAALLDVGGLWLLYRTRLHAATMTGPWPHLAVSAHVLAAGYLFTFAVLGRPDPAPHRAPIGWRAGTLVAAVAAHDILAKVLYAYPPAGVPAEQARRAGELMYYGGAPVEIALIVLLCRDWLGRAPRTRPRRSSPGRRTSLSGWAPSWFCCPVCGVAGMRSPGRGCATCSRSSPTTSVPVVAPPGSWTSCGRGSSPPIR
ncbi:cytochrome c oxidase assembly protein [Actinophytocola sp.]|uniref:cytochrome c oxidase assembly protein n=1 Tax=Actinophytocola sp. TaxID=1872138 RepID=UPI003899F9F9